MARGVTVDFNANVARFTSGIDKATNDLSKFQSNAARISKNINDVLGNIGVGLSAAGVVAFGQSVIDGLDKLNDLSKTTGLAVNQLAGLGVAAKQSGADLDSVAAAVSKLSVNMGKDSEKFRALGITAKDPLEALKQLADVFVAIKDPQERAAVAAEALGKSWQGTAPLLSEGGAAIGRMVTEGSKASGVTQEMAEQADKFNDELEKLKANISGVTIGLVGGLVPAMNDAIKNMKNLFAPEEDMKIAVRLNYLRDSMDSIITRRQLLAKIGIDSSSFWAGDLDKLNKEAITLEKSLKKLQDAAPAPVALPKGPSKSSISAFLGNDTGSNSAKATAKAAEAEAKRLADAREKIFQHEIDTEREAFDKLHKDKEKAARDAQTALNDLMKEGQSLKMSVDPMAKMNAEIERYSVLLKQGAIDQKTFDLAVAQSTENMKKATTDGFDKMSAAAIGFQTNVQRNLGDGIFKALSGDFDNIGEAWKNMLFRMASDALAANVSSAIFGKNGTGGFLKAGLSILGSLGSLGKAPAGGALGSSTFGQSLWPVPKFAAGGDFMGGLRLVGENGPELEATGPSRIFNAKQTKDIMSGGGRGVSVNYSPVIQIDSRTDRNEVHAIVSRAVKQGNADLVDKLTRQGAI
jgi:hypothetical protein